MPITGALPTCGKFKCNNCASNGDCQYQMSADRIIQINAELKKTLGLGKNETNISAVLGCYSYPR